MSFEKRGDSGISIPFADICQSHCTNMSGGKSSFNTAHGQQEYLARRAKNSSSQPC